MARGLSNCDSRVPEHRLNCCDAWAQFLHGMGTLLDQGSSQCPLHCKVDHQGSPCLILGLGQDAMWLTWASQASREWVGKEWHVDAKEKHLVPKFCSHPCSSPPASTSPGKFCQVWLGLIRETPQNYSLPTESLTSASTFHKQERHPHSGCPMVHSAIRYRAA